ncbi:MAG: sigma-54-dependent Fis family transcriptional regulator [Acidobacteria bacterium]|nr:sigma-54-dependent Fis family transcriptional regulator [Acidobacteriota bacterium]
MADKYNDGNPFKGSSILDEKIALYARVPHYVLITGERGTGKTTLARRLHEMSPRSRREFVSINCASFTAELLESELFGYEKGAFTGANAVKSGLFETADGGTLFLDEVGELSLSLQAKLLKAVEEKRIRRVGGNRERDIDVRIIAATSKNLHSMVRNGAFRADLFDRLDILQLETIPLRFQREQIRDLFIRQMEEECAAVGRNEPFVFEDEALEAVQNMEWRGNYREIKNFAARLAVEALDERVITADIALQLARSGAAETVFSDDRNTVMSSQREAFQPSRQNLVTVTLDADTDDLDSVYVKAAATFIEHALKKSRGNLRRAARSIGTTHSTLSRILKKHKESNAMSISIPDHTTMVQTEAT